MQNKISVHLRKINAVHRRFTSMLRQFKGVHSLPSATVLPQVNDISLIDTKFF